MAAQVILELIPDVSKVKAAIDQLGDSGAVSDSSAASFKAGNAEIAKRNALLTQQASIQSKIQSTEQKEIATLGQIQKAASAVAGTVIKLSGKEFQAAMLAQSKSADQLIKSLSGVTVETNKQAAADESLRSQKRKLTEEIGKLIAAGQQESATFKDLVARAGEIDDAMKDASDAISRTGSDTRGLDTAIQLASGVAAGFTVATSAAALFGEENEDVQKVLLKVNAAMALLNGLQQIQNLLKSEYIKSLVQTAVLQKVQNAQLALDNALTSTSIVVRGAATLAQRALNLAMSANPIGLVVVALTAAIAAMKAYTDWAGRAAQAQAELNAAADESGLNAEFDAIDRAGKKRIADLQAAGAKQSDIDRAELGNMRVKGQALASELTLVRQIISANEKSSADNTEAKKREYALTKQLDDLNADGYVKKKDLEKSLREERKASAEEATKQAEAADAAAKKAAEEAHKRAVSEQQDRKAAGELALLYATEGSEIELEARIDVIHEAAKEELLNADLTANQIKLIKAKAAKEEVTLRKKFRDDEIAKRLQEEKENIQQLEQIRLNQLGRGANDVTKSESARFHAAQAVREEELNQILDHQDRIEDAYAKGTITFHQYEIQKTEALEQEDQKRFEIVQASAAREKAIRQAIASEAIAQAQNVANAIFEVGKSKRDAELQYALDALNREKEYALATKNLTESQKSAIQKKYDSETRRLKNEAARKERKAAIAQAIVNGLLAVTNALATVQPFWAALIAAAGAGIAAGVNVAKISSTPLPAYEKGTTSAAKGYALVGEKGPEIVEFGGGEKVWTATQSDKMMKEWNAANHSAVISDYRANTTGSMAIDYDQLGKAVAKYMPKGAIVHNTLDKEGYTTFIIQENHKRTIRNKTYSTR